MVPEIVSHINLWAVLFSAIAYFLLGLLWYSPFAFGSLLTKPRDNSWSGNPLKMLILFFFEGIACYFIAILFEWNEVDLLSQGLMVSGLACLSLAGSIISLYTLVRKKTAVFFLVHFGYHFGGWLIAGSIMALY